MYISFAVFCVLNIVTAVFVDYANKICVDEEVKKHAKLISDLSDIFNEADENGEGTLDLQEFEKYLAQANVQSYFRRIDLDTEAIGARNLFTLLDFASKGEIDVACFTQGISRLKGHAKSFDMYRLHQEVMRLDYKVDRLLEFADNMPSNDLSNLSNIIEEAAQSFFEGSKPSRGTTKANALSLGRASGNEQASTGKGSRETSADIEPKVNRLITFADDEDKLTSVDSISHAKRASILKEPTSQLPKEGTAVPELQESTSHLAGRPEVDENAKHHEAAEAERGVNTSVNKTSSRMSQLSKAVHDAGVASSSLAIAKLPRSKTVTGKPKKKSESEKKKASAKKAASHTALSVPPSSASNAAGPHDPAGQANQEPVDASPSPESPRYLQSSASSSSLGGHKNTGWLSHSQSAVESIAEEDEQHEIGSVSLSRQPCQYR